MTEEQRENTPSELEIHRILIALDASTSSLAALQAAARLAAAMHAELVGLFVEDEDLMRMAALPFTQELRWPTARRERTDEQHMEHALRLRASQARRALALAADRVEVGWTFRVVRGRVTQEVLEACLEADMLSLGRTSQTMARRARLGSTARAVMQRAPLSILLVRHGTDLDQPLIVTYDGSSLARRGLEAALRLTKYYDNNLIVLVLGEDREAAAALVQAVQAELQEMPIHADFRFVPSDEPDELAVLLQQESCGLVILAGETPSLQGEALQALLDALECPVMVVR